MSLKDLLQLLDGGSFLVIDNDSALRTTAIDWWNPKDAQLKTLHDKKVRHLRLRGGMLEIEVSEKAPDEGPDKAAEVAETRTCDRICSRGGVLEIEVSA